MSNENLKAKIYADEIVNAKVSNKIVYKDMPALNVGGKNPILIKEYNEVIPYSETNYPNITPSTTSQRIYSATNVDVVDIDLDKYDYVLVGKNMVEYVYTDEVPSTTSHTKKVITENVQNFIRIKEDSMQYTGNTVQKITASSHLLYYHQANQTKDYIGFFNAGAFILGDAEGQAITNNTQIRLKTANVNVQVDNNRMRADAFELVDAEKTTITFNIKVYAVDKGTAPVSTWAKEMLEWVVN